MAQNGIEYLIKIVGNAAKDLETIRNNVVSTNTAFNRLGDNMLRLDAITNVVSKAFNAITSNLSQCSAAWQQQTEAETKLAAVMSNTMDASKDEVQSILEF